MKSNDTARIDDQIVVVTGASSGIGLVTARELARRGAQVVLVCRDPGRGADAQKQVAAAATRKPPELLLANLSSMQSVRGLAAELRAGFNRIDVLLHNAGAIFTRRQVTVDGFEETLATNHLAPFLLTHLVRDRLEAAPAARVVTVSSRAHLGARIDFDDLQSERNYRPMRVYGQSKLCNVMFTYELARRLSGTRVIANCLHPGVIGTNFGQNTPGLFKFAISLARPFMKSPEAGSQTSIYVASSPQVAGVTGTYFVDSRPARSSRVSHDVAACQRLWDLSAELTRIGA